MWTTREQRRVPADAEVRMGAAETASSADFRNCSHGCGSHHDIAVQAPDTPSPLLSHFEQLT